MYNLIKYSLRSALNEQQLNQVKKAVYPLRKAKSLSKQAIQEFRVNQLGQIFPLKPDTLNLLVNDVCNSRCQMCLIWKQKKDKELTPNELAKVLDDELFCNLKYIGVSGGEPTLRDDLPQLFEAICSKKPSILGTGIITNAIIKDVVKERILAVAAVCQSHEVPLNVMISLDGVGEVHDTVRGRKNNFESAISLLRFFHRETDISTSFGCTITKSNALYVDELLDFVQEEGIYGRFRIAEYIDRLYNRGQTQLVRSFDAKTRYHLGLFFFRAEHEFETNLTFKKTYRNIRAMLVQERPRQIGCPYQSRAAVLTAHGDLLYCSPKSPSLGNTLVFSAKKLYFSQINRRKEIIKKDCDHCIHDYHVPLTVKEKVSYYLENRRRRKYNCECLLKVAIQQSKTRTKITDLSHLTSSKVLIVGWYGTETAGDKAILWTVINRLRSRPNPPEKIYLSSLYPFISEWTIAEMELGEIEIVETYSAEFEAVCDKVDEVLVGGGPLMDIEPLNHILYSFMRAARHGAIARIEGCGVGPLCNPIYTQVVSEIFRLSDFVSLRDAASANRSVQDFPSTPLKVIADPATEYVEHVKNSPNLLDGVSPLGMSRHLACFIREWTTEYKGKLDQVQFDLVKHQFEEQLSQLILRISSSQDLEIQLLPMHTFQVGGDDRVFARRFAKVINYHTSTQNSNTNVKFARGHISPLEILQTMQSAQFNVCMRFHSVLFAETLGVPYLAIDYTGGGKIKAFLESKGKLDRLISLQDVAEGKWENTVENCLAVKLYQ